MDHPSESVFAKGRRHRLSLPPSRWADQIANTSPNLRGSIQPGAQQECVGAWTAEIPQVCAGSVDITT